MFLLIYGSNSFCSRQLYLGCDFFGLTYYLQIWECWFTFKFSSLMGPMKVSDFQFGPPFPIDFLLGSYVKFTVTLILVLMMSPPLPTPIFSQDFFLWFSPVWMWYYWLVFFLFCFVITTWFFPELPVSFCCLSLLLKSFQLLSLQISNLLHSLSSFSSILIMHIIPFHAVPWFMLGLFYSLFLFFAFFLLPLSFPSIHPSLLSFTFLFPPFLFQFGSFCWHIFKATNSFSHYVDSTEEIIQVFSFFLNNVFDS